MNLWYYKRQILLYLSHITGEIKIKGIKQSSLVSIYDTNSYCTLFPQIDINTSSRLLYLEVRGYWAISLSNSTERLMEDKSILEYTTPRVIYQLS